MKILIERVGYVGLSNWLTTSLHDKVIASGIV